ncbi:MAG: AraC family transcriptional regulator [Ruminococcus sp.]|jgi:AraC-like DNA-binding protein
MKNFYPDDYVPFPQDGLISIEYWDNFQKIPNCDSSGVYPPHRHDYHELVLITSGLCLHTYKGSTITLIPGDMFLIPPHRYHSYKFQDGLHIYNCQFYISNFSDYFLRILDDLNFISLRAQASPSLSADYTIFDAEAPSGKYSALVNQQGILHLNSSQRFYMENLLTHMQTEQRQKGRGYTYILHDYLEILLCELSRIKHAQYTVSEQKNSKKERMIMDTLAFIDSHLTEDIDFLSIAESYDLSPNYFRTVFREITGISPTEYLNRTRILNALKYLRMTDMTISDIAASVGLYDANYFTRLFKKYLGYPPTYFKHIFD